MNAKVRLGSVLALLTLLLGLTAAAPPPALAAVEGCTLTHPVVAGEYLSKIAAVYKVSWLSIAQLNDLKNANLIYPGQVLCITSSGTTTTPPPVSGSVRVYAASVVEDKAVTLKGKSLDVNSTYSIYLSNYKRTTLVETLVGSVKTDASGGFTHTVSIPKNLIDVALVRVRVTNSRGDSSTNWFINTTGSVVGGVGSPAISIAIDDVKEGDWVKFTASNLPSNVAFNVYIAKGDSSGAIFIGMIHSSSGGKVTATFDLPTEYLDRTRLEIQLENGAVLMEAVKDFDND
ncbi:MAG TPA: LysM domain-containing protein [Anaerolineales bacterium]|nr:LysM domain-containing protein [Anaerolineales bacterium]